MEGLLSTTQNTKYCDQDPNEPIRSRSENQGLKNFIMMERGDCKFTKKIILSQKLNADLAIIYDNASTLNPAIVMKNDGHGNHV